MLTMKEQIKMHFIDCYIYCNYNKRMTAEMLGVTPKTVFKYVIEFDLENEQSFNDLDRRHKMNRENPSPEIKKGFLSIDWDNIKYFATNKERLAHADSMINRTFL